MVTLKPMTEAEYQTFIEKSSREFMLSQIKDSLEEIEFDRLLAEKMKKMLPSGLQTPNHYFFSILEEDSLVKVGELWFAVEEKEGEKFIFVYDIRIAEPSRRKGYGSQAFQAMENKARQIGIHKISLHVFGDNLPARAMYKKLGYVETHVMMEKIIQ